MADLIPFPQVLKRNTTLYVTNYLSSSYVKLNLCESISHTDNFIYSPKIVEK